MSIECTDFLEQIKQYFGYLFDQYGFEVVHSEAARSGEYCFIVLQSRNCRIKFYRAQGEVNLLFGTLSAHIGWEDVIDGTKHWYYARSIMDFIEKKPVDVRKSFFEIRTLKTENQQLRELSMRLQPLCSNILQLFRIDNFKRWRKEYEQFEQERNKEFRKQFERQSGRKM